MRGRCAAILTTVAVSGFVAAGGAQPPASDAGFVAFRVDTTHAVATLEVIEVTLADVPSSAAPAPLARFGYPHFNRPAAWKPQRVADPRVGDRWRLHLGADTVVHGVVDRLTGGQVGCEGAVGVRLAIVPEDVATFAQRRERYYVAEPAREPLRQSSAESQRRGPVGPIATPTTLAFTRALEETLNATFTRELPRLRSEAAAEVDRHLQSDVAYRQTWARERLEIEDALRTGRGRLRYDVQSFRLAPDALPVHFVRAEWLVGQRQGFAATFWLRGVAPLSVLDADTQPSVWLRMPEFDGAVSREQLGLVLNVVDRNRDGWGEVLFAKGGYEALHLSLRVFTPGGFQSSGIGYSAGC